LNPTLGIDDFGPFPSSMTRRNAFRGPGAWNADLAVGKSFSITEDVKLQPRAEGFDIFNHHNLYVNESALSVSNTPGTIGAPLPVIALKGGLNSIALGANHDERRFGQFSLRLTFRRAFRPLTARADIAARFRPGRFFFGISLCGDGRLGRASRV
jgi:hypothetical protein